MVAAARSSPRARARASRDGEQRPGARLRDLQRPRTTPPGPGRSIWRRASRPAPESLFVGGKVTWTVTVTNVGPDAATNVVIEDSLPDDVSFVDGSLDVPSNVTCVGGRCTMPSLAVGASVTRHVRHHRHSGRPKTNTVTVDADQTDANPADNAASASGGRDERSGRGRRHPVLECVGQLSDGLYRAHFGYLNRGQQRGRRAGRPPQRVHAGAGEPRPAGALPARPRPRCLPGRLPGRTLVWTLTGRTSTASASSKRCAPTTGVAADRQDPAPGRRSGPVQPRDRRRSRRVRSRRRPPRDDRRRRGTRRAAPRRRRRSGRDLAGGLRHDDRLPREPRARRGPVGLPRPGADRRRRGRARSRLHDREHAAHGAARAAESDAAGTDAASVASARDVGPRGAEVRQRPCRRSRRDRRVDGGRHQQRPADGHRCHDHRRRRRGRHDRLAAGLAGHVRENQLLPGHDPAGWVGAHRRPHAHADDGRPAEHRRRRAASSRTRCPRTTPRRRSSASSRRSRRRSSGGAAGCRSTVG